MTQISNNIYCADFLISLDIKTKLLPNPYYDYPYLIIENLFDKNECNEINKEIKKDKDVQKAQLRANTPEIKATTNEEIRKTNIYALNKTHLELYKKRFFIKQNLVLDYF